MVETRNQKRKNTNTNTNTDIDTDTDTDNNYITQNLFIINKKRKTQSAKSEESMSSKTTTEIEDEIEDESTFYLPEEFKIEMSECINKILLKYFGKIKNDDDDKSSDSKINEIKELILDGEFFEYNPKKINLSDEEKNKIISELNKIEENYKENTPSFIKIMKMNISLEKKQKLLEHLYCLVSSDLFSPDYDYNYKMLTEALNQQSTPSFSDLEQEIILHLNSNNYSCKDRILNSNMSFENKIIAYKKYTNMDKHDESKYLSWFNTLLSIPFGVYNNSNITIESPKNNIQTYIKNVRTTLDEKLLFLEKPKDQIINIITQSIRNKNSNINAIGLCGGPGVGKTAICESIAKALNRPFAKLSCGGLSDISYLTGHNFTYVGSQCGRLVNLLIESKSMNPVVLLDEIDKISESQHGQEITAALIHLTDTTTNHKYNLDNYFSSIDFDFSKTLFICTYNDHTKVDPILLDRLFKIHIDKYDFKQKLEITKTHIIKNTLLELNLNENDISFTDNAIEYLIQQDTNNGMRDIKSKIKVILSRINTLLLTNLDDNIIKLRYNSLYDYYHNKLNKLILTEHIDIFLDESAFEKKDDYPHHMYI